MSSSDPPSLQRRASLTLSTTHRARRSSVASSTKDLARGAAQEQQHELADLAETYPISEPFTSLSREQTKQFQSNQTNNEQLEGAEGRVDTGSGSVSVTLHRRPSAREPAIELQLTRRKSHVSIPAELQAEEINVENEEIEEYGPVSSLAALQKEERLTLHESKNGRVEVTTNGAKAEAEDTFMEEVASQPTVILIPQPPWAVHLVLVPASIVGYYLREAFSTASPFSTASFPPTFFPNFLGCLVMGFFQAGRERFWRLGDKDKGQGWLWWFAVATGLCGSFTTFSSFSVAVFNVFAGSAGTSAVSGGQRFVDGLATLVFGSCVFVAGILVGAHMWAGYVHLEEWWIAKRASGTDVAKLEDDAKGQETETFKFEFLPLAWTPFPAPRRSFSDFFLAFLVICSITAIVVTLALDAQSTIPKARSFGFGMLFAPLGTLLRYKLSRYNVPASAAPRAGIMKLFPKTFPAGTFFANVLGTAILSMLFVVGRTVPVSVVPATAGLSDSYQCALISAASDGFCGCLTTVSTLCFELVSMSRVDGGLGRAYRYGSASALAGLLICTAIIGGAYWGHGWGMGTGVFCS